MGLLDFFKKKKPEEVVPMSALEQEILEKTIQVLEAIKFPYSKGEGYQELMHPLFNEKEKCLDGVVRGTYTVLFLTAPAILEQQNYFAVVDAETKKVLYIMGPLAMIYIDYADDGTITRRGKQ